MRTQIHQFSPPKLENRVSNECFDKELKVAIDCIESFVDGLKSPAFLHGDLDCLLSSDTGKEIKQRLCELKDPIDRLRSTISNPVPKETLI